jgi:hypothetical protein
MLVSGRYSPSFEAAQILLYGLASFHLCEASGRARTSRSRLVYIQGSGNALSYWFRDLRITCRTRWLLTRTSGNSPLAGRNGTPHEQAEPYRRLVNGFRWLTEKKSNVYNFVYVRLPRAGGWITRRSSRKSWVLCKRLSSDTGSLRSWLSI